MDDKRFKRVLANRQSAARSRERKIQYEKELRMNVERLQIKADNISAEIAKYKRLNAYSAARINELRKATEAMSQELQRRRERNQALEEEIRHLLVRNIHMAVDSGDCVMLNYFLSLPAMRLLTNHSPQQPQLGASYALFYQPFNGNHCPNFMDFNKKK